MCVGGEWLPLSRAAIGAASGACAFLIDALLTVIVYLPPPRAGQSAMTLPLPPKSALRAAIGELREGREVTPRVLYLRGGAEDCSAFEDMLLDDGSSALVDDSSFASFLAAVDQAAAEALAD